MTVDFKICPRCCIEKPRAGFHSRRQSRDGMTSHCTTCRAVTAKKWREKNLESTKLVGARWRSENREHLRARGAERSLKKRAKIAVAQARTRSRKSGVPCDLDGHIDEIQARMDAGVCELSGLKFDMSPGRTFRSPSLDRKAPSLGYVYSNLRVVCFGMNTALGNWGDDAFRLIAEGFLRKNP